MTRVLLVLIAVVVMFGQTTGRSPATVTSSSAFKLAGTEVPVAGVPAWPVAAGDLIQAGEAPAVVAFADGSRVTLSKGSKAKVEKSGDKTLLRLIEGSCTYTLASRMGVGLFVGDKAADVRALRGTLSTSASVVGRPVSAEAALPPPPIPLSRY